MVLFPNARRRSVQLKRENIERKIAQTQDRLDLLQRESGCRTPDLFVKENPGVAMLTAELRHLEERANQLREELRRIVD